MKSLSKFIFESYFDEQNKFVENMIKVWKSNKYEELKQFDIYFKWKDHELSTAKFKAMKKEIRKMWDDSSDLLDNLYDNNKDKNLIDIVQAVNAELETIYMMIY